DRTRIGDRPVVGDLGPGTNPHPVGLRYVAVARERVRRRLALRPDALLECTRHLRLVRLADEVAALVVEGRVEEEPLVLESEVLLVFADAALAQRYKLLAFGERAHGHGPFFESNRHSSGGGERMRICPLTRRRNISRRDAHDTQHPWNPIISLQIRGFS